MGQSVSIQLKKKVLTKVEASINAPRFINATNYVSLIKGCFYWADESKSGTLAPDISISLSPSLSTQDQFKHEGVAVYFNIESSVKCSITIQLFST